MNIPPPEPPKMELVKEDYNPIKILQRPHSAHSIKTRYEKYPWISKYREFVPYNEWEKQKDESREVKKTN